MQGYLFIAVHGSISNDTLLHTWQYEHFARILNHPKTYHTNQKSRCNSAHIIFCIKAVAVVMFLMLIVVSNVVVQMLAVDLQISLH